MGTPTKGVAPAKRTRRNLTKGAALMVGALAGLSATNKPALARYHGPCFLRGTRIRTAKGYRKIETLAVGDLVPTRFGGLSPIKAVGRHSVRRQSSEEAWPDEARPVCVRQSALDEGVPSRDLYLTPTHAVFIDDVLVPVGDLVNEATIAFDDLPDRNRLDYFHIEVEGHDVIDADGAACETLLGPAEAETQAASAVPSAHPTKVPCAPVLSFNGGRNELKSRLRSAASVVIDRRQRLDIIRDKLEERSLELAG